MNLRHFWFAAALVSVLPWNAPSADTADLRDVQKIGDEWADVFYKLPTAQQTEPFKALLERIRAIKAQFPARAEPLVMEAIILCTLAASDWGFASLSRMQEARELLIKSIDFDPRSMEGSAFITLGNLYYRLPGWPISFGDDSLALQYLESASKLYPDAIDVNFFLGDYWLREGDREKAQVYLVRAEKAPIRSSQRLSDEKLKEQIHAALEAAQRRTEAHEDYFSRLLPELTDGDKTSP